MLSFQRVVIGALKLKNEFLPSVITCHKKIRTMYYIKGFYYFVPILIFCL